MQCVCAPPVVEATCTASSLCIVWRRGCLGKKCANAEKNVCHPSVGSFPVGKKKKMSFCHPVVSLLFPFPDPFKLLCKKCSLIGVRACVLPRPRECLCGGLRLVVGRPPWHRAVLLRTRPAAEPRRSPPTPPASRSEIVHRNPLAVPPAPSSSGAAVPAVWRRQRRVSRRAAFLWPFYLGLLCPLSPRGGSDNNN